MDARRISVSLRRDPREIAERHSQANPLTLFCELARGEEVTETLALYAELHTSRTPASSPVATAGPVAMTTASVGPWELDFSAAQMNQTVLPGEDKEYWLVVYATGASDLLLTLGTIRLTLAYDNISQVTPAPPEPALIFAFRTIAVAGQSSIVADSSADTLTIAAGDGIILTTNPGTDTLTISSNASGSGDVVGPASATDDALARFNGTTGKLIQSSTATLTDAGLLTVSDASVTGTLTAPHIHGNLAGAVYSHVRNESGGTLTKGTPVYIVGYSVGQSRPLIAAANAASAATMPAIGILDEDLANNASGHCVIIGTIENFNTAAYSVNAPLYVASGGGLTATAPSLRAQSVAIVERVNANNGAIIVTAADVSGSMAQQSSASVNITGGTITGITDLAIADGGTGASDAAGARTNLQVPSITDLDNQRVDIQTFGGPSSSGNFTWTKPAGAKLVMVRLIGGGGGGASGACNATTAARSGGGGGSGGHNSMIIVSAADLGSTVAIAVGAGGSGGAGSATTGGGLANGSLGDHSTFGNFRSARGNGANGATGGTALATHLFNLLTVQTGSGGAGSTGTGGAGTAQQGGLFLPCGGGGGGGAAANSTTSAAGGAGGGRSGTTLAVAYTAALAGGAGGTTAGVAAESGQSQDISQAVGTAGGGGFYISGQNGGSGGNGGWPGGAGGGGGAADAGFASGSGGSGANGMVQVITFY
jgi:hypothetical protein